MQETTGERRRVGRPKKEGETKQASVRIRPSLQRQLVIAAERSGRSVAAELESRISSAFEQASMGASTRALLDRIAERINEVEAVAGNGVTWDKSLRTWAIVREILANGPILEAVPHPDPSKVKDMDAKRTALAALQAERRSVSESLRAMGIRADVGMPTSHGEILAAALTQALHEPTAPDAHGAIDERVDLPDDVRSFLHGQVERLVELDDEIDKIRDALKGAIAPYVDARLAAREFMYGVKGQPDLPDWLTSPVGMEESTKPKGRLPGAKR